MVGEKPGVRMSEESVKDEVLGTIIEGVAKLAVPEPMITDDDVAAVKSLLLPGDCIVTRRNYELSNAGEKILTKSFWGHATWYLGDGILLPIYEAVTKDGFRRVSLERLCFTKDAIGICRLPGSPWTQDQIAQMKAFADTMLGFTYDFSMDWQLNHQVYCSEAVIKIWEQGNAQEADAVKTTTDLGQMVRSPQNIWDSTVQIKQFGYQG